MNIETMGLMDKDNSPRGLSENGYFPQFLRQAHPAAAGLKILQCILAVKIFAFLDFTKNLSFSDKLPEYHRHYQRFQTVH